MGSATLARKILQTKDGISSNLIQSYPLPSFQFGSGLEETLAKVHLNFPSPWATPKLTHPLCTYSIAKRSTTHRTLSLFHCLLSFITGSKNQRECWVLEESKKCIKMRQARVKMREEPLEKTNGWAQCVLVNIHGEGLKIRLKTRHNCRDMLGTTLEFAKRSKKSKK